MRMGIYGKKLGMTQIFNEEGLRIPVTVIKTDPNVIIEVKTMEKHGYNGIRLGFEAQKSERLNAPDRGQFVKRDLATYRNVREIRFDAEDQMNFNVGQEVKVEEIFRVGDPVDVTGKSKGKGTQGVMKRYNFAGFESTHGAHEYFRHGGSIGCRLTPGRVVKGKKMNGRMGNRRVTIQNLKVARIMAEDNVILVAGAVPGSTNGTVFVRFAAKKVVYL
ncbi:50S ribosomal protein L3 [Myxococcota bacterium]|nr:50S ribosomal protein L3 [Myxococcota bacterium]MBU1380399.1 50S ribosomal protein L3 [Myxococcota bacterium]MBU1498320.1 50S ribosomal protein L3 [Myxococcota bacterium]